MAPFTKRLLESMHNQPTTPTLPAHATIEDPLLARVKRLIDKLDARANQPTDDPKLADKVRELERQLAEAKGGTVPNEKESHADKLDTDVAAFFSDGFGNVMADLVDK